MYLEITRAEEIQRLEKPEVRKEAKSIKEIPKVENLGKEIVMGERALEVDQEKNKENNSGNYCDKKNGNYCEIGCSHL